MTTAQAFENLFVNLRVEDEKISKRYHEITKKLNKTFRNTDSETANCLQVGSYGRYTGIKGISDLDMLYIMPKSSWDEYKSSPDKLLAAVRDALKERYQTTKIWYDRLVVDVRFTDFMFEVQPVFEIEENGEKCFKFPDTKSSDKYRITKPLHEQKAMTLFRDEHGKHHRYLCKIVRAWKNTMGVGMGGLLIDTLTYKFLIDHPEYDNCGYCYYDTMCRDFFAFLKDQPKQDHYQALGSGQDVKVKHPFKSKAAKTYKLIEAAIAEENEEERHSKWREVFGRSFPKAPEKALEKAYSLNDRIVDNEQFIEDEYAVDVRYDLRIDCKMERDGCRPKLLRSILSNHELIPHEYSLVFYIDETDIIGDYEVKWKVRNVGPEAIRRNCLRGQLLKSNVNGNRRRETSNFRGPHYVECYLIQDKIVVARDRINVPIE